MKTAGLIFKTSLILTAAFLLLSCNALERNTQSASILIIERLQGTSLEGDLTDYLHSDVLFEDPDTGDSYVKADSAVVTFRAQLLAPNPDQATSLYNDIQVERYVVTYSQPDGSNMEGRDVPYSFEGRLSALVKVGTSTDIAFVVVRDGAKKEAPLVELQNGVNILQVIAKIDFYGKDLAGKAVKATGHLNIFFANYINE